MGGVRKKSEEMNIQCQKVPNQLTIVDMAPEIVARQQNWLLAKTRDLGAPRASRPFFSPTQELVVLDVIEGAARHSVRKNETQDTDDEGPEYVLDVIALFSCRRSKKKRKWGLPKMNPDNTVRLFQLRQQYQSWATVTAISNKDSQIECPLKKLQGRIRHVKSLWMLDRARRNTKYD